MSVRIEKLASVVRHGVGDYFSREIASPPYGFVTVLDVIVSPDIRHAKIYVSIFGNEELKEKTLQFVNSRRSEIRHILGKQLQTKFTPEIHFFMDETLDRVEKLEKIFKEIHKDESTN
ncbi:MAG: 30S ribosome-binding factor RbfA [Bacteroidetes bacterium]|nr:30S ribosome-binding factor RbfA [Bacteroidota bacterium]